jgi:hypothetical protein
MSRMRRQKAAERKGMVPYFADGKVVMIPRSELAPGSVQASVVGINGRVWLDASKVGMGPIRHPPFDEGVREFVRQIQATFAEHRPMTFEEWEDGFRRDTNPAQEIAIFLRAARIYAEFAGNEPDAGRRAEIYRCLTNCMVTGPDEIWAVWKPKMLSQGEAENLVERFFGRAPA